MQQSPKNPTREEIAEILYAAVAAHINIQERKKNGTEDARILAWDTLPKAYQKFIYDAVDFVMANPDAGPAATYERGLRSSDSDRKFDELRPDEAYMTFLIIAVVRSQMGWIEERQVGA